MADSFMMAAEPDGLVAVPGYMLLLRCIGWLGCLLDFLPVVASLC